MSRVKLDSRLPETSGLSVLASQLWSDLGGRYLAVVEFRVSERTEPDDEDEKAEPSCRVALIRVEVAEDGASARTARKLLDELRAKRTSAGTLDEVDTATGEIAQRFADDLRDGPLREGSGIDSITMSTAGSSVTIDRAGVA